MGMTKVQVIPLSWMRVSSSKIEEEHPAAGIGGGVNTWALPPTSPINTAKTVALNIAADYSTD